MFDARVQLKRSFYLLDIMLAQYWVPSLSYGRVYVCCNSEFYRNVWTDLTGFGWMYPSTYTPCFKNSCTSKIKIYYNTFFWNFPKLVVNLAHKHRREQVCVQLPTSAVNVTLPAFAAAAPCCCGTTARPAPGSNRPISPARQALSSKPPHAAAVVDRRDRRSDGRTPDW